MNNGMLEALMTTLKFAYRQKDAMYQAINYLKQILTFKVPFKSIFVTWLAAIECFGAAINDTPRTPRGPEIDLSAYTLYWADEFEGDALDMTAWHNRKEGVTRSGYSTFDLAEVKDGNLVLNAKYIENGKYGDGWYACEIESNNKFCGGYIEMRAILGKSKYMRDYWSCFWISNDGVYDADISKGGPGGCEIDIVESFCRYTDDQFNHCITPALWCNGVDDNPDTIDGRNLGNYYITGDDPFTTYHTYGLAWTDTEYIWYVDGVEATRISYGNGTSQVPEYIILGVNIPTSPITERDKNDTYQMIVDYVRVYKPVN